MKGITCFILLLLLSACMSYKDVRFEGVENFKIKDFSTKEVLLTFNVKLFNPNNYKIKVKPGEVDVLNNKDKLLGKAKVVKKVVIDKNMSGSYPVTIKAKLSDFLLSGGGSIFDLIKNRNTTIRFRGDVKVKARGLGKKIKLDETKSFDLGKFMPSLGM